MSLGALASYGDSSDEEQSVVLPSAPLSRAEKRPEAQETRPEKRYRFLDELPPENAEAGPDEAVVASLRSYIALRRERGFDLTDHIKSQKDFGNPQLLAKVIAHFGIDPLASNYPPHLFDPQGYSEEDYLDAIRQRAQAGSEPAPSAAAAAAAGQQPQATTTTTATETGAKPRRARRWDVAEPSAATTGAAGELAQPQNR